MTLGRGGRLERAETRLARLERDYADLLARVDAARGAPDRETPDAAAAQTQVETSLTEAAPADAVFADASSAPSPPFQDAAAAAPGPRQGLEQRLGGSWAVWVGGLTLALGGLFLVRYSIEQGWISPFARVMLGAALAAALIGAGEWLRRRGSPALAAMPSAYIPGALTAAGVVTAFGVIYAAHALYGFIGAAAAFVLLGAAAVGALLASALHGPALAALGLAGSYATPLLIASDTPDPWPVVLFLAVVAGAAMALARLRSWLWLATTAVAGAVVWGVLLLSPPFGADTAAWVSAAMTHTALQTLIAALFMGVLTHGGGGDEDARADWIGLRALGALTILAALAMASDDSAPSGWLQFTAAVAFILTATAVRAAPVAGAAALAGFVIFAALGMWPYEIVRPDATAGLAAELPAPPALQAFPLFAALGLVGAPAIAMVAGLQVYRRPSLHPHAAAFYAGAAAVTPLAALIMAYLQVTRFEASGAFAVLGAVLALAFALAAQRFDRALGANPEADPLRLGLGACAAASVAAIAFALVCYLERGYLTVALALAALGAAYVASVRDIPALRYAVAALGFSVLGRIVWDPTIMGDDVGATPVFNWLMFGYGVPALSFAMAARLLRGGDDAAVRISDALSLLFGALLFYFQIRHALNAGDPLPPVDPTHMEEGLFAVTALGFAYALIRADAGRPNSVYRTAGTVFGVGAVVIAMLGLGLTRNPLFTGHTVYGPPVFSSLLPAYLLPAIMAGVLARAAKGLRPLWFERGAAGLSIALLFAYASLEVRHIYQGAEIGSWRETSAAEQWTYTVAWLALGLGCLVYGVVRGSIVARMASAALIVLTVLKAFLFDMSGLEGVWRAFSFIALGLVLMGVGLIYQRYVFPLSERPQAS
ncbi:MAG: DUF2339 domain-containing protein [Hyphomicrobiales bacterium]|nr:DUF2339 domain-containing protein [Hyphomicrobiales bacterium]